MFRKLQTRATAVKTIAALLSHAEEIARSRGAERPAAEHLVIAALQLPDGTAARALERLGSSAADFSAALAAQEDARRGGGDLVGAHVLRAAAALEHGPTARALRRMGIDRTELQAAASAEIQGRSNI